MRPDGFETASRWIASARPDDVAAPRRLPRLRRRRLSDRDLDPGRRRHDDGLVPADRGPSRDRAPAVTTTGACPDDGATDRDHHLLGGRPSRTLGGADRVRPADLRRGARPGGGARGSACRRTPYAGDLRGSGTLLDRLDGIVLSGGEDVCGLAYGREEDPAEHELEVHNPARDRFEIDVAHLSWERRIPLFAICRGLQVLNVALEGTLVPDLTAREPRPTIGWSAACSTITASSSSRGRGCTACWGTRRRCPRTITRRWTASRTSCGSAGAPPTGWSRRPSRSTPNGSRSVCSGTPRRDHDAALFEAFVERCGGVPSLR